MVPHIVRLVIIAVCFVAALVATAWLTALGKTDGEGFAAAVTALGIFGPALLDAERVRQRRKKASRKPEPDDDAA